MFTRLACSPSLADRISPLPFTSRAQGADATQALRSISFICGAVRARTIHRDGHHPSVDAGGPKGWRTKRTGQGWVVRPRAAAVCSQRSSVAAGRGPAASRRERVCSLTFCGAFVWVVGKRRQTVGADRMCQWSFHSIGKGWWSKRRHLRPLYPYPLAFVDNTISSLSHL